MSDREIRFAAAPFEVRAADDGSSATVRGYAAVFDQETMIGSYFRERIAPGSFSRAISEGQDVVFLVDHDGQPLARTRSGTLKLEEDERGLKIEAELDSEDPDAFRVIRKMKRGDLDKMSFAMIVRAETWTDESGNVALREIRDVDLFDVSVVTFPAYDGTEIGLRSLEAHRAERTPKATAKADRQLRALAVAEAELKLRRGAK